MNMPESSQKRRKPTRLPDYDYAQPGAYFVTIVTESRIELFGHIQNDIMGLSIPGGIVWQTWDDLPNHYPRVQLDAFVVMPNHVHGIIILTGLPGVGEGLRPSPTDDDREPHSLIEVVRALKSFSSRQINQYRKTPGATVWQRSFHDRIIRNDREMNARRQYIADNPLAWALDAENPAHHQRKDLPA
jgi:REP element-mobilizing transposase RayT